MRGPGDDPPGEVSGAMRDVSVGRLTRRADFLHVGKGRRWHGRALTLQASIKRASTHDIADVPPDPPRIGFTLTKKVGCAVVRNRARRRLREAVRLSGQLPVRRDHDYVIVGRLAAIRLPFGELRHELVRAMTAVHDAAEGHAGGKKRRGGRNAGTNSAKGTSPSGSEPERTRPKP